MYMKYSQIVLDTRWNQLYMYPDYMVDWNVYKSKLTPTDLDPYF